MHEFRQHDTSVKLMACFGLLLCMSASLSLWTLGQVAPAPPVSGGAAGATARTVVWVGLAGMAGVTASMVAWLRMELARPVQAVARLAGSMAEGDLSTHDAAPLQPAKDGVGALFCSLQQTNDRLAAMVAQVRTGAEQIAGSAGQLALRTLALSARSTDQAAALDATAHLVKRLSLTARAQASQARQAARLSSTTAQLAAALLGAPGAGHFAVMPGQAAAVIQELERSARALFALTAAMAEAGATHGEGLERAGNAVQALECAVRESGALLQAGVEAADALRGQAGRLSHATAAFVIGPQHKQHKQHKQHQQQHQHKRSTPRLYLVRTGPAPAAGAARRSGPAAATVIRAVAATAPQRARHQACPAPDWNELA